MGASRFIPGPIETLSIIPSISFRPLILFPSPLLISMAYP
jgi:hypothetical protein